MTPKRKLEKARDGFERLNTAWEEYTAWLHTRSPECAGDATHP